MKNLSLETMEKIDGGITHDQICQAIGWASAVGSGAVPGSGEFYVFAGLAYAACHEV